MQPSENSDNSKTSKKLKIKKSSQMKDSCCTDSQSNVSIYMEKENEQPNHYSTEKPGHMKSDTVICYSNEESQKYQLERVLKACIAQNMEASLLETSSFLYKTDQSNGMGNQTERYKRQDSVISPEIENLVKTLHESLKKQHLLEKKVQDFEKQTTCYASDQKELNQRLQKNEKQRKDLLAQISKLNNEVKHKNDLVIR